MTDLSTEEKIMEAAKKLFYQKGFEATKTRDIAEEAGINLALLNYYFRSKKKLFDLILLESFKQFIQSMHQVFNDETTSFEQKIEVYTSNYIDFLITQPHIPVFIMSELRDNPEALIQKMQMKEHIMQSSFFKQLLEKVMAKATPIHPLHFFVNMMAMISFPFIASPMLKHLGSLSDSDFDELMAQRKKMIPLWVNAMLEV